MDAIYAWGRPFLRMALPSTHGFVFLLMRVERARRGTFDVLPGWKRG